VLTRMRRLLRAVLNLVYPAMCVGCGARLEGCETSCVCPECLASAERLGRWQCERCGGSIGPYAEGGLACRACAEHPNMGFDRGTAVFHYRGVARQAVLNLKFRGDLIPAAWMGRELSSKLAGKEWFDGVEVVTPVPLHWTRRFRRRFNQSELIARRIAREHGKILETRALRRVRKTKPQSILEREQRRENVRAAFAVKRPERVKGRRVLLVDDVMSTCATASECARALKRAGARGVYVAVFAR